MARVKCGGSETKTLLEVKVRIDFIYTKGNGNKLLNPLFLCVPQGFLFVFMTLPVPEYSKLEGTHWESTKSNPWPFFFEYFLICQFNFFLAMIISGQVLHKHIPWVGRDPLRIIKIQLLPLFFFNFFFNLSVKYFFLTWSLLNKLCTNTNTHFTTFLCFFLLSVGCSRLQIPA